MLDQTLILVDENDNFLGYAAKSQCHTEKAKRHRAFVTLLFDQKNNVLLQKRKHQLFNKLWDFTAVSHPLHLDDKDESYQEASDRALFKEMGIRHIKVKKIGAFNYFAKEGRNYENEHCAVLVGNYDGSHKVNSGEVYETKKLPFEKFILNIKTNPSFYTPWVVKASRILEKFLRDLNNS